MTKKNLMPIIVLTAICLVVAALLGAVNYFTEPKIALRNDKAILESLDKAMPGGEFNPKPDKLHANAPKTVSRAYTEKNGKGTVIVLLTTEGYTGKPIGITVGISSEGKITGMEITQNEESIVPPQLQPGGSYGQHFKDKGADDIADVVTGATVVYTEGAIKNALNDAFTYLGLAEALPELPREESEIKNLAQQFYGNSSAKLESSTPEKCEYVKRIYKEKGKNSYVAYAFAYSQYGTPEFEFLVYVGEDGTVTAVNKILWKVSDPKPEWGYNPPSDEVVDAFFQSLVGKNIHNISSVDVATGVTNTSNKVKDAALECLKFAKPTLPRDTAEIDSLAKELFGNSSVKFEVTEPKDKTYVKRLYKDKESDAFVAYALAYSQYGTPEFEFLVYVDDNGTVKGVNKIFWKVSDPKPEWGYNPPSEEVVNAFFNSFIGKNVYTVTSVDVATGVTNTSNKVKDAALEILKLSTPKIPRDRAEIAALAKALYGDSSAKLSCKEFKDNQYARLAFYESGKKSYVAYAFAYSQYGTPEFEFLVYVDEDGTVKAVEKILWKVSDPKPEWGYNPPSEEVVNAFFDSFVGKNADNITDVDVATGVTNTSNKVKDAALETLKIDVLEKSNAPRIIGISILAAAAVATAAVVIITKKRRTVK